MTPTSRIGLLCGGYVQVAFVMRIYKSVCEMKPFVVLRRQKRNITIFRLKYTGKLWIVKHEILGSY